VIDLISKGLFFGGISLMVISTILLLVVGPENTDILGAVKEVSLFAICGAFMIAGMGLKYLFT